MTSTHDTTTDAREAFEKRFKILAGQHTKAKNAPWGLVNDYHFLVADMLAAINALRKQVKERDELLDSMQQTKDALVQQIDALRARVMPEREVDLSKARVGDNVVFRDGGRMPIGYIESFEVESHHGTNIGYFMRVGESEYSEHIGRFSKNGINSRHPYRDAYCEIVAVESTNDRKDYDALILHQRQAGEGDR